MRRGDEDDEVPLLDSHLEQKLEKWDAFENPPKKSNTGSTNETKWFDASIKGLKVFTMAVVFCVVLASAVISKSTLLLMTSQIKKNTTRPYCNADIDKREQFIVNIPDTERALWAWILICVYCVPELGTFIRSTRKSLFKTWQTPTPWEFFSVFITESLPAIGSAMLVFIILPELDVVKGAMLTNAVCFIPAFISFFSRNLKPTTTDDQDVEHNNQNQTATEMVLDIISMVAQASSFVVWPLVEDRPILYFIPVSVILISVGWWENFVSIESPIRFIRELAKSKENFKDNSKDNAKSKEKFENRRYFIYVFVSLWKCVLFFGTVMVILLVKDGDNSFMFERFTDGFNEHIIAITEIEPIIGGSSISSQDDAVISTGAGTTTLTSIWTPISIFLINIATTYFCYAFAKFGCKIMIQIIGVAFPINLSVPVLLTVLIAMSGAFNEDDCAFNGTLPKYLFFTTPPMYFLNDFISQQHSWVWLVWLLSQVWITIHLWSSNANTDKLSTTEELFLKPMYDAFLIDQSIAMNRRRRPPEKVNKEDIKQIAPNETRIYACGTMWHENREEMEVFLKSIMRLDADQCAHKLVRKHFVMKRPDYYEFETHIFFDDAFVRKHEKDQDPRINNYVRDLVQLVDKAASEVLEKNVKVQRPTVYPTPYGGRLEWVLPGQTKMIAHLKDKAKIRAKKRWSQVMYMYYLLGHRIVEDESLGEEIIDKLSENTYILALDGDIDFQPNAVHLLVDYMKRNKTLGAACGRIHPVGSGGMAWYQIFEYAVGHWLQKATEHVIGCVLCSPGCFSLFRGQALMAESVMAKYTTVSTEPLHYVQYDQGEDRWLCTLLLQQGYRVEYSAASDAYTHCPEGFNEFYNQRRRWMPSTIANIFDLLGDYKQTVKINDNISTLYIYYQIIIMIGTVIGPGTIFLMLVGAFVAAFKLDQWSSFMWNVVPILIFVIVCATTKSDTQLFFAGIISAVYGLIMMAVFVGVMLQISDDGFLAPSSLFFFCLAGEMIIAALLHPKEFYCLKYGVIYYVTVPSMYMLLVIYSVFNMNNVSWGTREVTVEAPKTPAEKKEQAKKDQENKQEKPKDTMRVLSFFGGDAKHNTGSLEFSCAGLFKCLFCTHPKDNTELKEIQESLKKITKKLAILNNEIPDEEDRRKTVARTTVLEGPQASRKSSFGAQRFSKKSDVDDDDDEDIYGSLADSENVEISNSWIHDEDLKHCPTKFLNKNEEKFWRGLLDKYLHPIDDTDKKKEIEVGLKDLRDKTVITFFMLNSLFVLVVFLLTLEKDTLHLNWPIDPKINFTYLDDKNEIQVSKTYLQLEPIGFVFLIFFALLLVVQFGAMIMHRFGTYAQIMANTKLDFFGVSKKLTPEEIMETDPVKLVKRLIKLDSDEPDDEPMDRRRKTIAKIVENRGRKTQPAVADLEEQFKKHFDHEDFAGDGEQIRRKTLNIIKRNASQRRRTTNKVSFVTDD